MEWERGGERGRVGRGEEREEAGLDGAGAGRGGEGDREGWAGAGGECWGRAVYPGLERQVG